MSAKKILIVDDEETNRKIITLALEGEGREVIFAGDGEEAFTMAKANRPDLIIMDVMLPKINGFEATRRIRGDEELKDVPVIALTARTMDFDKKQAEEAGCDDFITKPFRIGELRRRIESFLS